MRMERWEREPWVNHRHITDPGKDLLSKKKRRRERKLERRWKRKAEGAIRSRLRYRMGCYVDREKAAKDLGYESYAKYTLSSVWLELRKRVLTRDVLCLSCCRQATQVHHLSYCHGALSGNELQYLVSLCGRCHKRIERDRKTGRKVSLHEANFRLLDQMKKSNKKHDLSEYFVKVIGELVSGV